uniref:Transposase n=1 Tax=Haemonchus placei TaxID=6290 RepID=A0A0N4X6X7_HAEPC
LIRETIVGDILISTTTIDTCCSIFCVLLINEQIDVAWQ